jgi:hypothetical protein
MRLKLCPPDEWYTPARGDVADVSIRLAPDSIWVYGGGHISVNDRVEYVINAAYTSKGLFSGAVDLYG